ncbi:RNA exonuclease 4 [Apiospora saccharicola]|uniref:RNA exonuclease 4 n=1 Tax=Apiospora saccharicola TaxID=335842 RepID=A0ABR1UPU1_9PEZI
MAPELSSNWKKLQEKLKAQSPASTAGAAPAPLAAATKRKPVESREAAGQSQAKKRRVQVPGKQQQQKPSAPPQKQRKPATSSSSAAAKPNGSRSSKPASSMGNAESSVISKGSSATVRPSLALWAADNDISPEDLAEAYGLGLRRTAPLNTTPLEKDRVNEGLAPNLENLGKYVGLDCEMVGTGPDGHEHALARASLVDFHGRQIYDSFVRPQERVTDWRTSITGITPKQMGQAREFEEVQREVAELLQGRILVGHDLRHDLDVLQFTHPATHIRDTARFAGYKRYGNGPKPALRTLAKEVLDMEIQSGHHSSIEDARVAMLLFRTKKSEFDMEHANKFEHTKPGPGKSHTGKNKKKKTKH